MLLQNVSRDNWTQLRFLWVYRLILTLDLMPDNTFLRKLDCLNSPDCEEAQIVYRYVSSLGEISPKYACYIGLENQSFSMKNM